MEDTNPMTAAEIRRLGRLPADLREDFEERAAIMEFDGGLKREEAEIMALRIVEARSEARATEHEEKPTP